MTAPTPKETKNPFAVAANKIPVLLFPFDQLERDRVEAAIVELNLDSDKLPKLVSEIKTAKLNSNHVVFTAVCVPTKVGLQRRPENFRLVISPGVDCGKFQIRRSEDELGSDVNVADLVDEIQKHVRPFVAKLSADMTLKLGLV